MISYGSTCMHGGPIPTKAQIISYIILAMDQSTTYHNHKHGIITAFNM